MPPRRAEAPSTPFRIRLSPAELHLAQRAAKVNHQNVSEFLRDALVTAAEDCLESRARARVPIFSIGTRRP